MNDTMNIVLDLVNAVLRRYVMIYLLQKQLAVKGRFAGREKQVMAGFVAVTMTFYVWVNYSPLFRKLLYGSEEGILESRASILPLFMSLSIMLIYCLYFYAGKRSKVCYLVFTVYTINELTMFTLHSLFVTLLVLVSGCLMNLVVNENQFVTEHFMMIYMVFQMLWNLAFQIVLLVLFYRMVKRLGENLSYGRELNKVQEVFLVVPSLMGMCFCILLRSIMYTYNETGIRFLMDEYPESRILIPMVSGLCLLSILLSASILKRLVESSEREMLVEVYQNQIRDMEEHMKDVEHLYDGIRGMRHDMKNHVADLELLLQRREECSEEYREEMRQYLDGLCLSMEELDMKCSSGNPVTDVVLSRKIRKARQEGISMECDFIFPEGLGISAFDLSIILNNGLDNALEASAKEENGYVKLESYRKGNMFFVEISNRFSGSLVTDDTGKNLQTGKPDPSIHGLGIKNMKSCAEKYYGTLRWEHREKEFLLAVMLQGKEK